MKTYHVYERMGEYKEYWSCEEDGWRYLGNWYSDPRNYIHEDGNRMNGWHVENNPHARDCPDYYRLRYMTEQEYLDFAEICLLI